MGDLAFLPDGTLDLKIVPVHCVVPVSVPPGQASPVRFGGLVLRPNPGVSETKIRFETRGAGQVRAEVYDPAGRLVRSIFDGTLGGGLHDLHWDGRNEAGRAIAAGVYLIRIRTARGLATGRLVVF